MKSCLAEEWFIEDSLVNLGGLCSRCRTEREEEILQFGNNLKEGLSEIYKLSRVIRVQAVMGKKFSAAKDMGNWEVVRVTRTLSHLTDLGFAVLAGQKPELFGEA